jgi:hypothetical protein
MAQATCPECLGDGKCNYCGDETGDVNDLVGSYKCPKCGGTKVCQTCGGSGLIESDD